MDTIILIVGIWVIALIGGYAAYLVLVKKWNLELVFLAWALLLAGSAVVVLPMINPDASSAPVLGEMGTTVVGTFVLVGSVRLINLVRSRFSKDRDRTHTG